MESEKTTHPVWKKRLPIDLARVLGVGIPHTRSLLLFFSSSHSVISTILDAYTHPFSFLTHPIWSLVRFVGAYGLTAGSWLAFRLTGLYNTLLVKKGLGGDCTGLYLCCDWFWCLYSPGCGGWGMFLVYTFFHNFSNKKFKWTDSIVNLWRRKLSA